MLEDHYALRTVDRIRGLWLGSAIERYVDWLVDQRHAPGTIRSRVQCLVHFDAFAAAAGAASWNELPALSLRISLIVGARFARSWAAVSRDGGQLRRPTDVAMDSGVGLGVKLALCGEPA